MSEIVNKSEEQKVAEAEVESFRKDLGPFVVAAETTRMAMMFTDAKETGHPIIFANDAFLSLSGYDREEVLGQSFKFLMARGTDPEGADRPPGSEQGRLALVGAGIGSHPQRSHVAFEVARWALREIPAADTC